MKNLYIESYLEDSSCDSDESNELVNVDMNVFFILHLL